MFRLAKGMYFEPGMKNNRVKIKLTIIGLEHTPFSMETAIGGNITIRIN